MHITVTGRCIGLLLCLLAGGGHADGQLNCMIFSDSAHVRACRLYNASDSFPQGSRKSQLYLDSAIRICPGLAAAWREIGVPFLKRGDFLTWRKYIDKAVELEPMAYLGVRGWCRFKFLRDYEGALSDLRRLDTLTGFEPGPSGDGSYDLHIVMALCERELGNDMMAFHYFALGIDSVLSRKGAAWIGLYDYLHRAVAKMKVGDYTGALQDLDRQLQRYDKYAEIFYYQGLIYRLTGREKEAVESLEKATLVYAVTGTHFTDPYCEVLDQVYLNDIEDAINKK